MLWRIAIREADDLGVSAPRFHPACPKLLAKRAEVIRLAIYAGIGS